MAPRPARSYSECICGHFFRLRSVIIEIRSFSVLTLSHCDGRAAFFRGGFSNLNLRETRFPESHSRRLGAAPRGNAALQFYLDRIPKWPLLMSIRPRDSWGQRLLKRANLPSPAQGESEISIVILREAGAMTHADHHNRAIDELLI